MQVALQQTPSTHLFDPHSDAAVHTLPFGLRPVWHVPAASHYEVPLHGVVAIVSCAPAGRLTQLPSEPATAHDWQVPVHVPLQQMPSTQLLLPQSVDAVQV